MRQTDDNIPWVVYTYLHGKADQMNAVCEQSEWDAMELARPGCHTLVRADIASEAEAERLARGTSGDAKSRAGVTMRRGGRGAAGVAGELPGRPRPQEMRKTHDAEEKKPPERQKELQSLLATPRAGRNSRYWSRAMTRREAGRGPGRPPDHHLPARLREGTRPDRPFYGPARRAPTKKPPPWGHDPTAAALAV